MQVLTIAFSGSSLAIAVGATEAHLLDMGNLCLLGRKVNSAKLAVDVLLRAAGAFLGLVIHESLLGNKPNITWPAEEFAIALELGVCGCHVESAVHEGTQE